MAFVRTRTSRPIGYYWADWRRLLAGLFVAVGIGAMQPAVALPKNTVVATIAVGYDAQNMVITPNGQTLYVSNIVSKNISVIDTASNTVKTSIALGAGVNPLAITPDGQTLFAEFGGFGIPTTIAVISTATNTVTNTFPAPVAVGWFNLAVSPDGKQLWVADWFNDAIVIIDIATLTTVSTIDWNGAPAYLQFAPDGTSAYVLEENGGASNPFIKLDVASQQIVWDVTIRQAVAFAIAPDGATLYICRDKKPNDSVSVLDAKNGSQKAQITIAPRTVALGDSVVTPNGKYLYVPLYFPKKVKMVSTADNKVVGGAIAVGEGASRTVVAPNGNDLYVLNVGAPPKDASSVSVVDISE